jgi:hypothetical protein
MPDLESRSVSYLAAHHRRATARIDVAPPWQPFPWRWRQQLDAPLGGHMVYLQRSSERSTLQLLGHRFTVNPFCPIGWCAMR